MEALLPRCLDSLIIGEYLDKLEVWVVNDGSKDCSSVIGHEYEAKYPGVFNVIDKPNGNYGSCINIALPKCTGKYVKVLDSDDFFDSENLKKMVQKMHDIDVDIFCTDFQMFGSEETLRTIDNLRPNCISEPSDFGNGTITMHNIAYRTDLIHSIGYTQTEGISYTDTEWVFYPFCYIKSLYYLPIVIYKYYYGREGQTMDPAMKARNVNHFKKLITRMLPFYIENKQNLHPNIDIFVRRILKNITINIYSGYLLNDTLLEEDLMLLREIDKSLRQADEMLYKQLDDDCIYVWRIPFYYIKLFRNNHLIILRLIKYVNLLFNKIHGVIRR